MGRKKIKASLALTVSMIGVAILPTAPARGEKLAQYYDEAAQFKPSWQVRLQPSLEALKRNFDVLQNTCRNHLTDPKLKEDYISWYNKDLSNGNKEYWGAPKTYFSNMRRGIENLQKNLENNLIKESAAKKELKTLETHFEELNGLYGSFQVHHKLPNPTYQR